MWWNEVRLIMWENEEDLKCTIKLTEMNFCQLFRYTDNIKYKLDDIPLMRYVIGTLRDNQRGMTWQHATWHDTTWHEVMWHDVTQRDMTWHDNKVDNKALVVWPSRVFSRENLEHFCRKTNVWVTSKTSWTGRWPEFSRSPEHGSSVGMSAKDSLTSKT